MGCLSNSEVASMRYKAPPCSMSREHFSGVAGKSSVELRNGSRVGADSNCALVACRRAGVWRQTRQRDFRDCPALSEAAKRVPARN
jgi:hypothetical protein